jgi:riboflavin synthase
MFTGIVEELGAVESINKGLNHYQLKIMAPKITQELSTGDSIMVNGVCLTVTEQSGNYFFVDISPETLERTNIKDVKPGEMVNLERALTLESRLGGHLVSGHIDGIGVILAKQKRGNSIYIKIKVGSFITRYLVTEGSIAIDGVSLTVVDFSLDKLSVSVIPHTARTTTLGFKGPGEKVNIEVDMIAKYIEKFVVGAAQAPGLTLEMLKKFGFA